MASVYNRGSKDRPNWYARYKDLDGKWTAKPTGQPTKATAMIFAAEVEARVRRGMIGIPEPEPNKCDALSVAQLCERFLSDYIGPKIRKVGSYQQQRRSDYRSRIQPFPIAALALQKVRVVDVEKWRDELIASEGKAAFEQGQAFYAMVHTLSESRRLSRILYLAQKIRPAPTDPWTPTTAFLGDWRAHNPAAGGKPEEWYRSDPEVRAIIDADGVLGVRGLEPKKQ
mgnify:CR=1 FL=1